MKIKENANSMIFFMLQDEPILKTSRVSPVGENGNQNSVMPMLFTFKLHVKVIFEKLTK